MKEKQTKFFFGIPPEFQNRKCIFINSICDQCKYRNKCKKRSEDKYICCSFMPIPMFFCT